MNEQDLKKLLEACLLAAGRPVSTEQLLELFEERERPTKEQLLAVLTALSGEYDSRGVELVEVASGWRIQIRSQYVDFVSRLWQERPTRYSRALLETLALIAYRQPITRGEIEEIRGVAVSSNIMRTLHERNWIRVLGHREVPGRPEILGTTKEFLDYFGLRGLDQLPTLAELKDVENIGVQLEFSTSDSPAMEDAAGITGDEVGSSDDLEAGRREASESAAIDEPEREAELIEAAPDRSADSG